MGEHLPGQAQVLLEGGLAEVRGLADLPQQFQRLAMQFLGGGVKNVRRHDYV